MPSIITSESLATSAVASLGADISALAPDFLAFLPDVGSMADFTDDLRRIGFPVASVIFADNDDSEARARKVDNLRKLAQKCSYRLARALDAPAALVKVGAVCDKLVTGTDPDGKPNVTDDYRIVLVRRK